MADFHKPTLFGGSNQFEWVEGGTDPAQVARMAHDTAWALLTRAREHADSDPGLVARLLAYTDEHGIDAIAELWSTSGPKTLPGALWRIWLLRALIGRDTEGLSILYRRGAEQLQTADAVVAGAAEPTGPEEIMALADSILTGVFAGDFALALERGAAFCRIVEAGALDVADGQDLVAPERASALTRRASRFQDLADDLMSAARLWRIGSLT